MSREEFISSNPDSRELKRAVAVKMRVQGHKHREIEEILGVPSSYISRWEKRYRERGIEGLRLAHKGSSGYINQSQRQKIIEWLQEKEQRALWELIDYLEENYGVLYQSKQSYYELLKAAQMSWHKGKKSPQQDESVVQKQNEMINQWLKTHREEIQNRKIRVFALNESHLAGGDIWGYGWGNRQKRREIKVSNYRESQTYYGAVDCLSGELILQTFNKANSQSTIKFVKHLQAQSGTAKLVLIWDGASYHRSQEWRNFLSQVNQDSQWMIHCLRLAPYAPEENPLENIWSQLKQMLRKLHQKCRTFSLTKKLFELLVKHQLFTLPDLSKYDAFSNIIHD